MKVYAVAYEFESEYGVGFAIVTADSVLDCIYSFCEHMRKEGYPGGEEWKDYEAGNNQFAEVAHNESNTGHLYTNRNNKIKLRIVETDPDTPGVIAIDQYFE